MAHRGEPGEAIGHIAVAGNGDVHVVGAQVGAGHALHVFDGHGVEPLEVGGVVVLREAVALDVEGEAGQGLGTLEGQGEAAVEVVLDELERAVRGGGLDHLPNLGEELNERAVGDLVADAGPRAEAADKLIRPDGAAGAVGVALVLAEVLVQPAAEEPTEHGVHHAHGHDVRVAGLEVDREGDVDDALHGAGHGGEADAVPFRRHRAGEAVGLDLVRAPLTEVLLGLLTCGLRGDVPDDDEIGHIGLPDGGVVGHQVLPGDGRDGLLVGALSIGVLQAVGHGAGEPAGNLVGVRCAAGESAEGLLALLFEFLLREGGVHEDVAHQLEQGFAVLDQTAAVHAEA